MPRANNGQFTLVAGNPVLADTTIESSWANATLADIAQGLTDSLSRNGSGGMLVPFEFADGSASKPSITFASQPSTGLYKHGNTVRMGVLGVNICEWSDKGLQIFEGTKLRGLAVDTDNFIAQDVVSRGHELFATVATGAELFSGIGGRTNAQADASLKLADSAIQKADNVSELTNDSVYINKDQIPPATKTTLGGIKYEFDTTTKILKISV